MVCFPNAAPCRWTVQPALCVRAAVSHTTQTVLSLHRRQNTGQDHDTTLEHLGTTCCCQPDEYHVLPFAVQTRTKLKHANCKFACCLVWVSQDSSVGIAIALWAGVRVPTGVRLLSSSSRPGRHCGPPSLLSTGYRGLFLLG
jgi:hypothetical protein